MYNITCPMCKCNVFGVKGAFIERNNIDILLDVCNHLGITINHYPPAGCVIVDVEARSIASKHNITNGMVITAVNNIPCITLNQCIKIIQNSCQHSNIECTPCTLRIFNPVE